MGRGAIQAYKDQRGTGALTTENGIQVISIILLTLQAQHPTDFPAQVRTELRANFALFKGVDEEVTGAMLEFTELQPILQEWRSGRLAPIEAAPKL